MSEEIRASVQYGDMRGTIAIDGWDHIGAQDLGGGWPKGYWPVGFSAYAEPGTEGEDLDPDVCLLLVDEEMLEKRGADGIHRFAKQHDHLPVFQYETKIKLSKFLSRIKRLSIVMQDNCSERVPLMLADGDIIYRRDE